MYKYIGDIESPTSHVCDVFLNPCYSFLSERSKQYLTLSSTASDPTYLAQGENGAKFLPHIAPNGVLMISPQTFNV